MQKEEILKLFEKIMKVNKKLIKIVNFAKGERTGK